MEIGKATAIFKNIDKIATTDAEKVEAINEVVKMSTYNGIAKTDVLHALNWAMKYCLFQEMNVCLLERRLKHLLQSDFIRSFDEVNVNTKEYKRDIKEADARIVYLCDGEKCENGYVECKYTTDITHAKNFEYGGGSYWEKSESVRNCPKVSDKEETTNISLIAGPNGVYTGCINCNAHIVPNPHFKYCPECGRKIV